ESLLVHTYRRNTGIQFTEVLSFLYNTFDFSIFSLKITISYNFIYQIILISSFLALIYLREDEYITKFRALSWSLSFTILLTILMHRGNISNWAWATPLLIIYVFSKQRKNILDHNYPLIIFIVVFYTMFLIAAFYYNNTINYSIFQSYSDIPNIEDQIKYQHLFSITSPLLNFLALAPPIFAIIFSLKKYRSFIMILTLWLPFLDMEADMLIRLQFNVLIFQTYLFYVYVFIRIATIIYLCEYIIRKSKKFELRF
ncbi:MAG: hypothetical protein ACTSVC_00855, partial [Promethearchaeota archaeon]